LNDSEIRALDAIALAPLEALDGAGLYTTVRKHGITMCGVVGYAAIAIR
jgi:AmmeMemoRadiSam system protein B